MYSTNLPHPVHVYDKFIFIVKVIMTLKKEIFIRCYSDLLINKKERYDLNIQFYRFLFDEVR